MVATKRMCEMIVQTMNNCSNTEYVSACLGNVLGSNIFVIPLFNKPIKAGAYAKGGKIFILDMGKPVKIMYVREPYQAFRI